MSTVIEKYYDPQYEPSKAEIEEYGRWLGMDLPADSDLLFLAREGLKAPLPEGWKACKSEKGELYYFNFKSGKSIWDHPMDDHYKEALADHKRRKANGEPYGVDHHTVANVPVSRESSPAAVSETSSEKRTDGEPSHAVADDPATTTISDTKRKGNAASKKQRASKRAEPVEAAVSDTTIAFSEAQTPEATVEQKVPMGGKLAALKTLKAKKDTPNDSTAVLATEVPSPLATLTPVVTPSHMDIDEAPKAAPSLHRKASSRSVSFADDQRVEEDIAEAKRQAQEKVTAAKEKALAEANEEIAIFEKKQLERMESEKKKIKQSCLDQVDKYERDNSSQIQHRKKQLQSEFDAASKSAQESHAKSLEAAKASFAAELRALEIEHEKKIKDSRSKSNQELAKAVSSIQELHSECLRDAWTSYTGHLQTDLTKMLQEHSAILMRCALGECASATQLVKLEGEAEVAKIKAEQAQKIAHLEDAHKQELEHVTSLNRAAIQNIEAELSDLQERKAAEMERIQREVDVATKAAAMSIAAAQRVETSSTEPVAPLNVHLLDEEVVSKHRDPHSNPSSSSTSPSSSHQPTVVTPLTASEMRLAIEDALRCIFSSANPPPSIPPPKPFVQRTVNLNSTLPVCFEDQRRMIEAERGRLVQARHVVEAQQEDIMERRRNLKDSKRQWKSDVIKAKNDGVRGDSEKGQLLRNVHKALERQEEVLRHDENVHRQSELWLQTKAERLHSIEQQLHNVEQRPDLDVSVASETSAMINDFFRTESLGVLGGRSSHPAISSSSQVEVAKALRRIEKRLDKFSTAVEAPEATRRAPLEDLTKINQQARTAGIPLVPKHSRKRSSSASKKVAFQPITPVSYI